MKPNWIILTPLVRLSRWNQATGPPGRPLCLTPPPMGLRRREQAQNDYRHAAAQWPLIEIAHVGNITNAGKSDEITLPFSALSGKNSCGAHRVAVN